ncbi:MAG: DUF262 domain-containing protein [Chloroflexi bacterium]|nr:DUF262 domain-containing protein [Chloroflexota bacterium]
MQKADISVGKLVNMIEDRELELPEMQRRYIWPATRVRDLLDSLYRGYPSGSILVWETDQEAPTREMAVSQKQNPFTGSKLLLDGQQRLTSLSAIVRGAPVTVRGRKRPIDILFNLDHPVGAPAEVIEVESDEISQLDEDVDPDAELDEESEDPVQSVSERLSKRTFVVASSNMLANPKWVRVSDIFNDERTDWQLLKPLNVTPDDPLWTKYTKRLATVRKIKDYLYVVNVLDKDLSYEEVAEIFVRVNSLGMKLRGSDLALAQITARWKNSLALLEEFAKECEETGEFTLDTGLLVRAIVIFATDQSRFKTVGSISVTDLQKAWEDAKRGIRFAINYLRANLGIEDESLLSSPFFILLVAYYGIVHNEKLSESEEKALRRWVYIAHTRGHYSRGSTETVLDADLNLIKKGETPERLIQVLEQQFGRLTVDPADFIGRGIRSSLFSMTYLALKQRNAKDWWSGLALSLSHQGRNHFVQYHHIFPKSRLQKASYEKAETNEIANMAFISGRVNRNLSAALPKDYFPDIISDRGKQALAAQLVPTDKQLWELSAYREFLEKRRALLADAVNELLAA